MITQQIVSGIVSPFSTKTQQGRLSPRQDDRPISWGYECGCYTFRLSDEGMYQVKDMPVHDPVRPVHERFYQMAPSGSYVVPPRTLVQGISIERFAMPSNVRGTIHPKSDYSRTGLIVFGGILYPGWHGHVVIEMQNAGDMPIKIYPGGGIATVVFEFCEEMIYAGRYQNQKSVVEVR